jgi:hypothetical protein
MPLFFMPHFNSYTGHGKEGDGVHGRAIGCVCDKLLADGNTCKGVGDEASLIVFVTRGGEGCQVQWQCQIPTCRAYRTIKMGSDMWWDAVNLHNNLLSTLVKYKPKSASGSSGSGSGGSGSGCSSGGGGRGK